MAIQKLWIRKENKNQCTASSVLWDQKYTDKYQFSSLQYHHNTEKPSAPLLPNHLILSCLDATVADKDHFMYRQSEMGEKHALLTVLRSLFLSGQMQTYWCPLWWLFVCASDNKVLSSFLMRSPGLHLWIFKENIPGEKYHGKFFFYVLTNHLLLLKYLSCCISKTI